jgi:hypothetical protein
VAGISAVDLFTLNTPLGAAIEQSVVDSLNDVREIWDPTGQYKLYSFIRQAQVFPDVRLETTAPDVPEGERILMGIELKGWFVLAKEGEPSFRYGASPAVCAPQDLLVVYPWTLDEVVSGSPRLLRPFIEEARYAAEHRTCSGSAVTSIIPSDQRPTFELQTLTVANLGDNDDDNYCRVHPKRPSRSDWSVRRIVGLLRRSVHHHGISGSEVQ